MTEKIEWVEGNVQTEVYKEINQCPIFTVNVNDEKIQSNIQSFATQKEVELDLNSDNSDDDDEVGEHVKTHESKTKMVFGEKNEFCIRPIPCVRPHKVFEFELDLSLFEKFNYN